MRVLVNQKLCEECGEKPQSRSRYDEQECSCGAVSVDGGVCHLRHSDDGVDMSVVVSDRHYIKMIGAIAAMNHNPMGRLRLLAQVLRDELGINLTEYSVPEEGELPIARL